MRIKKLEMVGFKSFKDRTVIQFDAGITGIVGPNGCGKSNIIDALVWVMGEQSAKHLRGTSMGDVIFGGAEGYAPGGMAEVSLTLENDGGPFPAKYMGMSEIQLTRRLYRSGESEYLINREPSRLRDIQEVFMDTGAGSKGFSIVEQGAIGKIITAKPEDRRTLIEEAAGITKFKVRKRESQKKLESTEQNLIRINDIVGELKRQIESLQRQAKRAERYRELKQRIEYLDLSISSGKYKELHTAVEQARTQFSDAETQEIASRAELDTLEALVQELQLQVIEKEAQVQEVQLKNSTVQSRAQKGESEFQNLKFEVEQAKRNSQMQGSVRQEVEARKRILATEHAEIEQRSALVRATADQLTADFEAQDIEYQDIQSRIQEIDDELTRARREFVAASQGEAEMRIKMEGAESRLSEVEGRFESSNSILSELKARETEFLTRRDQFKVGLETEREEQIQLLTSVEEFTAQRDELSRDVADRTQEVEQFKDRLNEVASRLYGLEDLQANFEGFEEGVKNVMLWTKKRQEELGADGSVVNSSVGFYPVSEVIEVEPRFELAMEAALGSRLQLLLSDNEAEPLNAVDYLKSSKAGRSGFLLKTGDGKGQALSHSSTRPAGDGVVGILSEAVTAPAEHRETVMNLLGGVAVVDSLNRAVELQRQYPDWTFVTEEGDTLTREGVMTGGATDGVESGILKRRREIKELSQQKDEWAGKLALSQNVLKKIQDQIETVTRGLEASQLRKIEKEMTITEKRKDVERAEQELLNLKNALDRQDREVNELLQQRVTQEAKLTEFREAAERMEERKSALETEVEQFSVELAQAKQGVDDVRETVTRLRVESALKRQEAEALNEQFERVSRNLEEVTRQEGKLDSEADNNNQALQLFSLALEETRARLEHDIMDAQQMETRLAGLRNEYEEVAQESRENEMKLSELRRRQNELKGIMNEAQLKAEQASLKETYILDQIRERYMIELAAVVEQYANAPENPEEARLELEDLRDKIKKIGEVNLSAIEEFEEVSKRYEFLNQQQEDLLEAKDHLRKVIDRINRICSKRFKETFEAVNQRFEKVFPVLFGGGEARLILVEDTEKDELGIDIVARPPGKKPQSITLLSGGEKALTAVSLIFAIFLVKPSPFCLLDEVDAPLDDANVARFGDLVREMAKRSQIIVITHNKATMEINEKLYGVTQQEKGVSKMVSVSLAEARDVAAS